MRYYDFPEDEGWWRKGNVEHLTVFKLCLLGIHASTLLIPIRIRRHTTSQTDAQTPSLNHGSHQVTSRTPPDMILTRLVSINQS
jgi:hypothetical protein